MKWIIFLLNLKIALYSHFKKYLFLFERFVFRETMFIEQFSVSNWFLKLLSKIFSIFLSRILFFILFFQDFGQSQISTISFSNRFTFVCGIVRVRFAARKKFSFSFINLYFLLFIFLLFLIFERKNTIYLQKRNS